MRLSGLLFSLATGEFCAAGKLRRRATAHETTNLGLDPGNPSRWKSSHHETPFDRFATGGRPLGFSTQKNNWRSGVNRQLRSFTRRSFKMHY